MTSDGRWPRPTANILPSPSLSSLPLLLQGDLQGLCVWVSLSHFPPRWHKHTGFYWGLCLQNRRWWWGALPWFRAQILARPLKAACVWGQVTCVSVTLFPHLPSGVNNSASRIVLWTLYTDPRICRARICHRSCLLTIGFPFSFKNTIWTFFRSTGAYLNTHISFHSCNNSPAAGRYYHPVLYLKKIKWLREVNFPEATWPEGIIR